MSLTAEDLRGLTDEELGDLRRMVGEETLRRADLKNLPKEAEELSRRYHEAAGVQDGDPWEQPVAMGYPTGAVVIHEGWAWVNRVPNNFHEPGVSGWRVETNEGEEPPPFVKPVSPFDAYAYGEEVTYEGVVYRSIFDLGDGLNYWSPSEMPEYWEALEEDEPEPEPEPDIPVWARPVWAGEGGGAYQKGDLVYFPDADGDIYESIHDGWNTWSPTEYPGAWRLISE